MTEVKSRQPVSLRCHMATWARIVWFPVRWLLILVLLIPVWFYQFVIGPMLPKVCRFYPSCSDYFVLAVKKHGPFKGAAMGVHRICRCNPWNPGGYDPP